MSRRGVAARWVVRIAVGHLILDAVFGALALGAAMGGVTVALWGGAS